MRALGQNPTHAEVRLSLHLQGVDLCVIQVNSIMAQADVDHNGKLDLSEFIVMMYNNYLETENDLEKEKMEEMKMAFRAFDTDGDGKVSKEELKICLMNFGQKLSDREIELLVKRHDSDKNGFLEFEEFVDLLFNIEQ